MSTNGTVFGVYPSTKTGTAANIIAGAFPNNPQSLDILQVINEGGKVIWNLSSAGVASFNPVNPSQGPKGRFTSLLEQRFGNTLAAAIGGAANKQNPLDLIQIYSKQGNKLLLHVSNTGVLTTP